MPSCPRAFAPQQCGPCFATAHMKSAPGASVVAPANGQQSTSSSTVTVAFAGTVTARAAGAVHSAGRPSSSTSAVPTSALKENVAFAAVVVLAADSTSRTTTFGRSPRNGERTAPAMIPRGIGAGVGAGSVHPENQGMRAGTSASGTAPTNAAPVKNPSVGGDAAGANASADAFLFSSTTETLGLVILEAMASGTPVIATPAGGVADNLRDEVNGLAFPARAHAEARSWEVELDRLDAAYREVLSSRPSR
ncbi:MAG: glycosyltransferase [Gemmatimonadetes bacterium]|nr:glycosyltransferase [Gemmatimonadota bacterium]